ncbi:MAG TPA: hypothetical protein VHW23_44010 [Kofleriaceae bacterium]|jgi:hypothetical protein|nr:hypothetical protein [Kofleriaceae bacterium]
MMRSSVNSRLAVAAATPRDRGRARWIGRGTMRALPLIMNNPILITKYSCIAVLCVVGVLNAAVVTAAPRRAAARQAPAAPVRAGIASAALSLTTPQGRKGVQDRANAPSRGLHSHAMMAGSSGASCAAPGVAPVSRPSVGWEECYDLTGTNTYVRLAYEKHPLPVGPCLVQVPQVAGGINHFNITTAVKGPPPDIFNYNAGARTVLDDEHIAIWKQGATGKTCVSWFESHPGAPATCRWSTCGSPPGQIFSPWTVDQARRYFSNALAGLGRTLMQHGVQQQLAQAIVFTVGVIVVLAAADAAAGALALLAL